MSDFLPYGRQQIDRQDIDAVIAVLKSDWLTTGPAVDAFEKALTATLKADHAIVCSSGTAALHLAAMALSLGPGDCVIVPTMTFLATANAVRLCGAEIVFADVDPASGLMGPSHLNDAFAKFDVDNGGAKTVKAVINVHYAGQCHDNQTIYDICQKRGAFLIEDACHAIGARYFDNGESVAVGACRHSDMAVFSFHPVKTITTGEGGIVTTRSNELADRLRRFRNHGITRRVEDFVSPELAIGEDGGPNPWYYEMAQPGLNYRAADIQCALGISQLRKLHQFVDRRAELVAHYDNLLTEMSPIIRPLTRHQGCKAAWHLYVVRIDFENIGKDRAAFMAELRAADIGSQVHYIPVHLQPYYRNRYGLNELPGAWEFYQTVLSLPLFPAMSDADADRVVNRMKEIVD